MNANRLLDALQFIRAMNQRRVFMTIICFFVILFGGMVLFWLAIWRDLRRDRKIMSPEDFKELICSEKNLMAGWIANQAISHDSTVFTVSMLTWTFAQAFPADIRQDVIQESLISTFNYIDQGGSPFTGPLDEEDPLAPGASINDA